LARAQVYNYEVYQNPETFGDYMKIVHCCDDDSKNTQSGASSKAFCNWKTN